MRSFGTFSKGIKSSQYFRERNEKLPERADEIDELEEDDVAEDDDDDELER